MQRKIELDDDFYRALFLLEKRFNYPIDLVRYWAFARTMSRASSVNRRYPKK